MVIHAAMHHGVHATGVTLAEEQFAYATEKVRRLGLQDRVTILLKDFRELDAPPFDKVSSIGMYEAVGLDNREGYFKGVKDRLRPRGAYLHHAITRPMKRNERVFRRKRPEFQALVNFIFPGGELDHLGGTHDAMERTASRSTTARACASITAAPAAPGPNGCTPAAPRPWRRSVMPRPRSGCSISPAARWPLSAVPSVSSRRWQPVARAARQACRRPAPTGIPPAVEPSPRTDRLARMARHHGQGDHRCRRGCPPYQSGCRRKTGPLRRLSPESSQPRAGPRCLSRSSRAGPGPRRRSPSGTSAAVRQATSPCLG